MRYFVTIQDQVVEVELGPDGIRVDGEAVEVDLAAVAGNGVRSLVLDGASYRILAQEGGERGRWNLQLRGRSLDAEVVDERTRAIREMTGAGAGALGPEPIRAPMPGLMVKVDVEEGDAVEPGQSLAIVEAMKMENELRAEVPATVSAVLVSPGQPVEKDQVLIEFAATEEEDQPAEEATESGEAS